MSKKGAPVLWLHLIPNLKRVTSKLALGIILLIFLFDYQPTLNLPPVKKSTVKAAVEQTQVVEAKSLPFEFQLPHPGYLSTHFSSYHPAIDIASGLGMPIHPIAKGVVTNAGFTFWGLGLVVSVDHSMGYKSLYAHMGKVYVRVGQTVESSDILGEVGLTGHTSGPHTHLEVSKDGINFDPLTILPSLSTLPKPEFLSAVKNTQVASAEPEMKPSPKPNIEQALEIIKPLVLDEKKDSLPIQLTPLQL